MDVYVWLVVVLAAVAFAASRAVPIWMDSKRREMPFAYRLRWLSIGIVAPSHYWWGARIEAMSPQEQADLLARETRALGLSRADSVRCPLCGAEVPHAWTLASDDQPTVEHGPVQCPQCDFRLDACRHCVHFLPGTPRASGSLSLGGDEIGFGRCGFYKTPQPVDQVCTPDIARRLKERGFEVLNAPLPIVDSFVPPDSCTAFQPDRKRLVAGGVRRPDARRAALLRILMPHVASDKTPGESASEDEQWLL